ncbi:MAG: hypothetical protein ACO3UU_12905, partial [Minisyncoccia bacterium]
MKNYNVQNYVRYKYDLRDSYPVDIPWDEYSRDELIIKFMPFAEQIAKSFSTTDQASGVMDITDLIQEANYGLVRAVDRIEWDKINVQDDIEKQIKGFISKRIKGSIRRAIDINRGDIRIPEHKLNEIRKYNGKDREMIQMFFNSIFVSFDKDDYETNKALEIEDTSSVYNINILNKYI